MPPNAYSSTQGGVKSNVSNLVNGLIGVDNTGIAIAAPQELPDTTLVLSDLIYEILMQNRDAILHDVNVTGNLNTECLSINNELSIGDTSGSNFKILQFITKDIYEPNGPDQVISDLSYVIINDISLSFVAKNPNSYYQISTTFNYLTSTYYNTFLKIGFFYKTTFTDLGSDSSENLLGEYILGSENANFTSSIFSKMMFIDISHAANDTIHFYLKGKIETDLCGNDFNYSDVEDTLKPKIIQSLSGNLITAAEYSLYI
tara:strand:+ start:92 stop:868 length:777 start_codon:yes stop_codon:yes gene_type:complete